MEDGFCGLLQTSFLNNKSHILFRWKIDTLALPQGVVDGEGINGHSEVFGVDLGETLSTRVVSEMRKITILAIIISNAGRDKLTFCEKDDNSLNIHLILLT